jgi:hypothetical protein
VLGRKQIAQPVTTEVRQPPGVAQGRGRRL